MIYPQPISLCTSSIENAGYENRMSGVVRGRRLITASYSIFPQQFLYFFPLPQGQGSLRPIFFPLLLYGVSESYT